MNRYYIVTDDNASLIYDGRTGQCVDSESNWIKDGENAKIRDGRLQCQRQRCANLNRDDQADAKS